MLPRCLRRLNRGRRMRRRRERKAKEEAMRKKNESLEAGLHLALYEHAQLQLVETSHRDEIKGSRRRSP